MLEGAAQCALEVREEDGETKLSGSFPYNSTATLSDGGRRGRPRKEKFAPGAFEYRVNEPEVEINLLVGHDFGKPLASKLSDTLTLRDTPEALTFEAIILKAIRETQHGRDMLAMLTAGLAVGISPGFRIPPERAVEDAEEVTEEPDNGEPDENGDPQRGALIRTIKAALLYELSIVTRPAFPDAQVEQRNWQPTAAGNRIVVPAAYRWR
mgnify:CR=1 FL=1